MRGLPTWEVAKCVCALGAMGVPHLELLTFLTEPNFSACTGYVVVDPEIFHNTPRIFQPFLRASRETIRMEEIDRFP